MDIKYPLAKETINKEDIDALCDWLKSYPRLTKGKLTWEVEDRWAKYIGTDYAVFNNSGSSANLLMVATALHCGKIPNKRVVVPSIGWVTTISPVIQLGLEPIMLGADTKTLGLNLEKLEAVCRDPATRPDVVIFVQVLGVPHYKEKLLALKQKYKFTLLEDACAALGSSYADGSKVGTVGDMSSFSFYFGHQLSTIEGGMVNTSDRGFYEMLLMLRSHGWAKDISNKSEDALMKKYKIDRFHSPFTFFVPGYNLRATDLQAFLGIRQIEKADWTANQRNKNHLLYAEKLKGVVRFQRWQEGDKPVSISFGALAGSKLERKYIVRRLVDNGIETRIFSAGNLGVHPFWTDLYPRFNGCDVSTEVHQNGFFLPNYPELTADDIEVICNVVKAGQEEYNQRKQ